MRTLLLAILCAVCAASSVSAQTPKGDPKIGLPPAARTPIDFVRDIQPIFAAHCYKCHDARLHKNGLRLDVKSMALTGGESGPAIVPGKSAESRLIRNVTRVPGATPMPAEGEPLTVEQIGLLRAWIDQGAPWPDDAPSATSTAPTKSNSDHWAYRPLVQPAPPEVKAEAWVRTPIDRFILARLEAAGLSPSPEADRRTLIRRLTFDLHGLPPTPEEVDAFTNDKSPDAYDRLVDRLLESPRYGERWGRHWLDVVHFGETHGFDKDKRRDNAWPYRDYVIRAFNDDEPYSRFIKEQIAGDALYANEPDAIAATGFLAAGPWDFVGNVELKEGTMEKARVRSLDRDDMLANTMSTFVSMTVHCARCHDHKFDPIPQKDYYSLQAVFAGIDRGDRPYEEKVFADFRATLATRRKSLENEKREILKKADADPDVAALRAEKKFLEKALKGIAAAAGQASSPSNGYHSLVAASPDEMKWVQVDLGKSMKIDSVVLVPARPTDFPDTPGFGFPVRFRIEGSEESEFTKPFTLTDESAKDFTNPGDHSLKVEGSGHAARFIRVTARKLWPRSNDYVFALAELQVWSGGVNAARGAVVTALDSIEEGRWSKRYLVDDFDSRNPLPMPESAEAPPQLDARKDREKNIRELIRVIESKVNSLLDDRERTALKKIKEKLAEVERWEKSLPAAKPVFAVVSHEPRPIDILRRGNVDAPLGPATPGALSEIPGLKCEFKLANRDDESARRAALAEWIANRENFLTWRSIVNRVWHYHFGRGIVDTPNDFGENGGRPSHPELLDWLAVEFRDHGESMKELHRLILMSAAYRQVSADNAETAKIDADNHLLWRMNRHKLEAEEIRDAVLQVSGRLDLTMGGPSFDLFKFKDDHSPIYDYVPMSKPEVWRRTVYQFTVRSVQNPFLVSLDCPDPSINTPVRGQTLTALQALALWNDAFMLDRSEAFARRVEGMATEKRGQIDAAYKLALCRAPEEDEASAMADYAAKHGMANACRLLLNTNEFIFID